MEKLITGYNENEDNSSQKKNPRTRHIVIAVIGGFQKYY